ncbi:ankyrin repeat domain-containing protein [Paenibacillus allorhizosphaerae]|nr:ankyrin repeat domain-containing protein [Paenibacillus allorhizosphaerae]
MVEDGLGVGELAEVFTSAVQAVKTGGVESLIQLLREHPELAYARSQKGRTLLNHLCDWPGHFPREFETGRALIAAGADVNALAIDPDRGETSLQWAVSANDVAMAELLIDCGAAVDGLNGDLRPLAQALFYGCREAAEMLVRRGATVTLEFAAGLGLTGMLPRFFGTDGCLLPSAGAHTAPVKNAIRPDTTGDERMEQALIYAVINNRIESAAYLLDRGADINAMPSGFHFRGTPLHWVAGGDSAEMVEFLVRRGADLHAAAPKDKATPLEMAEHRKKPDIVRLLKNLGAQR